MNIGPFLVAVVSLRRLAELAWSRKGPYRLLRHPNYLMVIGELVVVPLASGRRFFRHSVFCAEWDCLGMRILAENAALAGAAWEASTDYDFHRHFRVSGPARQP